MSLILALPTKQRIREAALISGVALALSPLSVAAMLNSTQTSVGYATHENTRSVAFAGTVVSVGVPAISYNQLVNYTQAAEFVANGQSPASVLAGFSTTVNTVGYPTSRNALIDVTGDSGSCSSVSAIGHTQSVRISCDGSVQAVAAGTSTFVCRQGYDAIVNTVANGSSTHAVKITQDTLLKAVSLQYMEQGAIRFQIVTIAQKEATFNTTIRGEFEIDIRDYSFKSQVMEVLEIDPADKEIKIDPDQKSFYV